MKVLILVLLLAVVISTTKKKKCVVQGWTTSTTTSSSAAVSFSNPFVQPIHHHHHHHHHSALVVRDAAAADDNDITNGSGNGDPSSPEWKGSTYSWTPPPATNRVRKRRETTSASGDDDVVITSIPIMDYDACSDGGTNNDGSSTTMMTIEIEEHPNDELLDSSTDRTGVILWSAAYSLAEYINVQCHERRESWNKNTENTTLATRRTCLELGAGLGLPSIVAAKHGWNCILTERDPQVMALLEKNLKRNDLPVSSSSSDDLPLLTESASTGGSSQIISIEPLDWTSPPQQQQQVCDLITAKYPFGVDLIVASDLIYAQTRPLWKDLLSVINQLRNNNNKNRRSSSSSSLPALERFDGSCSSFRRNNNDPLVLLGYTQRRRNLDMDGEREFFALVNAMGMQAVMIPVDQVPNSDKRLLTILFELRWKDE